MNHLYTFLAIDLARERAREAAEARRATSLTGSDDRPNVVRRGLASGLALVSRATADAAHRLDGVAVDDHDRTMATAR
jgi:hypothetical protein